MPAIVKIPINNAVIIRSRVGDTAHDNASQISVANKAPAVPGANGEKPEPKPVLKKGYNRGKDHVEEDIIMA